MLSEKEVALLSKYPFKNELYDVMIVFKVYEIIMINITLFTQIGSDFIKCIDKMLLYENSLKIINYNSPC